ncbi:MULTISPECIES: hypothetical protein [unclassified Guyparkeria]|uniref:hypothetical protein n=1 Tax=unclassified Guyparkeria TaxID=2626246 RepID=UPI00073360D6|nr:MULTISPECIES: hypothetical protein [unclassified Guyparkeria]KTG16582.1 hypothetical protein AUR63_00495 [Guyparkeria sp. XI15]OAE85616.1 hypothetical protein AWR35_00495 [Guyparkeria sp. WRN-7]
MTFARLVTLLLALWTPYNAVTAGVAMLDCPMDDLVSSQADQAESCPSHAASQPNDDVADCDHCGSCALLGGISVPTALKSAIVPPPQLAPDTGMTDQVAPGIPSNPFRPPLSA